MMSFSFADPLPDAQRVAVLGLAETGVGAVRLLLALGKQVLGSDTLSGEALQKQLQRFDFDPTGARILSANAGLEAIELAFSAGHRCVILEGVEGGGSEQDRPEEPELTAAVLADVGAAVPSPALRPHHFLLQAARQRNIPIVSEVELGALASRVPVWTISGTDGKTTTTKLLWNMARAGGLEALVCGNSWVPVSTTVLREAEGPRPDVLVTEVSAFQLHEGHGFKPQIAILTNVTSDHLDHYRGSLEAYQRAKRRVIDHLGPTEVAVLNTHDPLLRQWGEQSRARVIYYGLDRSQVPAGAECLFMDDGRLEYRLAQGGAVICPRSALKLRGGHNVLNALAAAGAALSGGVKAEAVAAAIERFEPPRHRLEYVATLDRVDYYDDSKATNPNAAIVGLKTFSQPVVLLLGGVDKGLDLSELIEHMRQRVRAAVVIGELRGRCRELSESGCPVEEAEDIAAATRRCHELAQPGDAVLLGPACSSWDMFGGYAERGDAFQKVVQSLNS